MKLIYLLLCGVLGIASSLSAATVTWVGSDGNWNQSRNWSGGYIPDLSDDVIINNGHEVDVPPSYWAFAKSLEVGAGSTLTIKGKCTVKHNAVDGIVIYGMIKVYNNLTVYGVAPQTNGMRIYNSGSLIVEKAGLLKITGEDRGIYMSGGTINNWGQIEITDIDGFSGLFMSNADFFNYSTGRLFVDESFSSQFRAVDLSINALFDNEGSIEIGNNNLGHGIYFYQSDFINSGGQVEIMSSGQTAILGTIGTFDNSGDIDILSGGSLRFQGSTAVNQTSGIISIGDGTSPTSGLYLSGPATFTNEGSLTVDGYEGGNNYTRSGIYLAWGASLDNEATGTIDLSTSFPDAIGIFLNYQTSFSNRGDVVIELNQIDDPAIHLEGISQLINEDCGHLTIQEGTIYLHNLYPVFTNRAWLDMLGTSAAHVNNSTFLNEGIIYDPNGTLAGFSMNNQGVIVDPLTAPVQANTVEDDALTLGSLAPVGNMSWHSAPGDVLAGIYVPASNSLVVLESVVGRNELYLEIELDVAGCQETRWLAVEAPGGVLPPPPPPLQQAEETTNASWRLTPNPATEYLEVTLAAEQGTTVQIQLVNQLGQLLFDGQSTPEEGAVYRIERPAALVSGWCVLRVIGEEGLLYTEPVVWR
jgi:hypothetical protein